MKMATALFAKTLEELKKQNELTPSSQSCTYTYSSGYDPVAGCCEHNNECRGSIKGGEFLD
jgi:hypothetical protein